jgi:hypothetical protein
MKASSSPSTAPLWNLRVLANAIRPIGQPFLQLSIERDAVQSHLIGGAGLVATCPGERGHELFARVLTWTLSFGHVNPERFDTTAQRLEIQAEFSGGLRLVPRASLESGTDVSSFAVTGPTEYRGRDGERNLLGAASEHLNAGREQAQHLGLDRARLAAAPETHQPHGLDQCRLDTRQAIRARFFGTDFGTEFRKCWE